MKYFICISFIALWAAGCQSMAPPAVELDRPQSQTRIAVPPRPAKIHSIPSSHTQPLPDIAHQKITLQSDAASGAELLFSIARDGGFELDLRADLEAPITLSVHQIPLQELLQRMALQGKFRFAWQNHRLVIENDLPYVKNYPLPMLSIHRIFNSQIDMTTEIDGIGVSNAQGNHSNTQVKTSAQYDFWNRIERTLHTILDTPPESGGVVAQPTLGTVLVRATEAQHRQVQAVLDDMYQLSRQQVLIEAIIVEVQLDRQHEQGVDMRLLLSQSADFNQQFLESSPRPSSNTAVPSGLLGVLAQGDGIDLQATLKALEQFGKTRVISKPRIQTMHQQPALLKVIDNRVYFQSSTKRNYDEQGELALASTEVSVRSVPVGLMLQVIPAIDAEQNISLTLRPTLTRILRFQNIPDPNLTEAGIGISNAAPELQIREMESILNLPSGATALLGGLIQESDRNTQNAIPLLGSLPGIGALFRSDSQTQGRSELLILIRATVIS